MDTDSFQLNIQGVTDLVVSDDNKMRNGSASPEEGIEGEYIDALELKIDDKELLDLRDEWENKYKQYYPKVEPRQKKNKEYYSGRQNKLGANSAEDVIASNLLFESEETFLPQALSKNPEPVVWSDNTDEGKNASNDIKTMLQYHADVLGLRKKLSVMTRHWSVYFLGVLKHGWKSNEIDGQTFGDIDLQVRNPKNFVLDPDGYVDEFGDFVGDFLGERMEMSAKKLIKKFPGHEEYIRSKVENKLGTRIKCTEWWTNEYCFTTFEDIVLEKHKNEYFNYKNQNEDETETQSATPLLNHFAVPKMPYTFLSVFSFQEAPHDVTNLIEQNIPNQKRITERDLQITKNLRNGNNSIAVSGISFNAETAKQAAIALEDGDPVLVPDGQVDNAIKRLPMPGISEGVFRAQDTDKATLRSVFGVQGLSAQPLQEDTTARGMILNQSHDSSRIGGGIGDSLEQVADNVFNWWLQLYYVFYDEPHYGAIMGNGRAVELVQLLNTKMNRHFVVSVSPNSMKPKDELSQTNQAIERWNNKAIDPIGFMKEINDPDPINSAKRLVLWTTNPQLYMQTYFPEQGQAPNSPNPPNPPNAPPIPPEPTGTLAQEPANASLSQVPLPK